MILFDGFGSFQRETENLACHQKLEVLSKYILKVLSYISHYRKDMNEIYFIEFYIF